ncbi:MAG: potassium transporter TrkG, partial [Gammaproteobacteria bacterium]
PNGVFALRLGRKTVGPRVIDAVWGFLTLYLLVFIVMMWSLMATSGLDLVSAYGSVLASLNNGGVGLGSMASHFAGMADPGKIIMIAGMILGRLEIFTVLVLFTPAFWRR